MSLEDLLCVTWFVIRDYGKSIPPLEKGLHRKTLHAAFGIPTSIPLFFITSYPY